MGVLGHLTKEERESLWETFEKKLKTGTPVLIGVLNKKFLSVPIGTPISIAQQDKNRYETFIKEINCNNKKKCEWVISYRISYKNKVIREITCPMNWNYESEEAVLKELSYANFRCVKVSDTLLFARKNKKAKRVQEIWDLPKKKLSHIIQLEITNFCERKWYVGKK